MPSSSRGLALLLVLLAGAARAQTQPRGFAVERLYSSAPGAGWIVMDTLDQHGGLGGAVSLALGYAAKPLRVSDGVTRIAVVADEALAEIGAALTWRRWRFHLGFVTPLVITGTSGTVGDYTFASPSVDLGANPDALGDARVAADVRIVGRPGGRFRFGAGAQLFVPFGNRSDYITDGTFRGMIRALFAGDVRWLAWAAQLGVHIRPLDDAPTPGSPKGSELLYGAAVGARLPVGRSGRWSAVVGPELFGATAFRHFADEDATALELLLGGRLESNGDGRCNLRVKLGVGAGINHHFGAAEWRVVAGVELFGQRP